MIFDNAGPMQSPANYKVIKMHLKQAIISHAHQPNTEKFICMVTASQHDTNAQYLFLEYLMS